jgi:lipoprotein NlpD
MRNVLQVDRSRVLLSNVGREMPRAVALTLVRYVCVAVFVVLLAACSSTPSSGGSYTVKRGDTLYSIAYRHGVDFRDVARWNGIGRDYTIYPGQILRLSAGGRTAVASARPAAPTKTRNAPKPIAQPPPIPWQWPVDGGAATLTERPNGGHGLTISGRSGQDVRAASSGRVVYLGTGLLGYGQLLIIKHSDAYLSAYGHTQFVTVKEGDAVAIGQRIATMGMGPQGMPMLYFEIRSNGTPGNPLMLLPRR